VRDASVVGVRRGWMVVRRPRLPRPVTIHTDHRLRSPLHPLVTTSCFTASVGLQSLELLINELEDADPTTLSDAESIVALQTLHSRFEALATKAVANFDASGDWSLDGAHGAGPWLATKCHMPRAQARRLVRRGRILRQLPVCADAWGRGEISADHVDAIIRVRRPSTEASLERDEALLVRQAKRLRFEQFQRAVNYWDQLADPDGTEEAAEEQRSRRDAYIEESFSGMYLGKMTLDPISGAIVSGELARIEAEFFAADWGKARAELGREPTIAELWRTPSQRRADAIVEMATRSATAPADGRRPVPLFSVLVGWETLGGRICQLAQGAALTPGSLVPWLEHIDLERAVFEPGGRVEVGITSRFFTGGTRRAIELRDRECTHPFCDVDAEHCQADHIIPYSEGGLTIQDNGQMLCGFHNRQRNQRPPPAD
jgi:hypothetical protein